MAVLLLVLLLSLPDVQPGTYSMPVAADALPILRGTLPMLSGMGILFYLSFLEGHAPRTARLAAAMVPGLLLVTGLLSALLLTAVGSFVPG